MKKWFACLLTACLCLWTVGAYVPSAAAASDTTTTTVETRAQFLASLCQTLDVQPGPTTAQDFSDVAPSDPAYGCIMAAYAKGWISGFPNGTFQPNGSLTREQMAKVEILALGLSQAAALVNQRPAYDDSGTIGKWAWGFVNELTQLKLLQGFTNGDFGPAETFTIDEGAHVTTQLQTYLNSTGSTTTGETGGGKPHVTRAPALAITPTAAASTTAAGATDVTAAPNSVGDTLTAVVSVSSIMTPVLDSMSPAGPGVTASYVSGSNLSVSAGDYVGMYEVDSSGEVVAFSEIQITAPEIGAWAPAITDTPAASVGTALGTTAIAVTPNNAGDTLAAKISAVSLATPLLGAAAPTGTTVVNPYASGGNLTVVTGDYVGIYELNASGAVVAFSQVQVTAAEIAAAPTLQSAETSTDGTQVYLTFSEPMSDPSAYAGEFSVSDNGSPISVASADVSGNQITLGLHNLVAYGDTVTVSYTGSDVTSSGGWRLATFSNAAVTNNLTPVMPALGGALTTTDGYSVILDYNLNIADPSAYANEFYVSDNGTNASILSVSSSFSQVIVTLASPVHPGDTVKASYTGADVETVGGTPVPDFTDAVVTNNATVAAPTLELPFTSTDGTQVVLAMSKDMNTPPADYATDFTVKVNGSQDNVTAAGLGGNQADMLLTVATPMVAGDNVTVTYSGTDVTATDGGIMQPLTDQSVRNILPKEISAATSSDGLTVSITFDQEMQNPSAYAGDFAVYDNGSSVGVSTAALDANTDVIDLHLAGPVYQGDTITVSYTGTDHVLSYAGGELAPFLHAAVADNSTVATAPVLVSTGTSSDGTTVYLNFSKAMTPPPGDYASDFAIQLNGSTDTVIGASAAGDTIDLTVQNPFTAADNVTASYSGTDVTSTDGGVLATITSPQTVANYVAPIVSSVSTGGYGVIVTFNTAMANPAGLDSDWTITYPGGTDAITGAQFYNNGLTTLQNEYNLTLATPIAYDATGLTLSYSNVSGPVKSATGGLLAPISSVAINNTSVVQPTLILASYATASGVLTLTFNGPVTASTVGAADLALGTSGSDTLGTATYSGGTGTATLTVQLSGATITSGDTLNIAASQTDIQSKSYSNVQPSTSAVTISVN